MRDLEFLNVVVLACVLVLGNVRHGHACLFNTRYCEYMYICFFLLIIVGYRREQRQQRSLHGPGWFLPSQDNPKSFSWCRALRDGITT